MPAPNTRLGYVSRARVTQIMNLLNLAPQIQEEILFLPPAFGRGPLTERDLRRLDSLTDWSERRWLRGDLRSAFLASSQPVSSVGAEHDVANLTRGPRSCNLFWEVALW